MTQEANPTPVTPVAQEAAVVPVTPTTPVVPEVQPQEPVVAPQSYGGASVIETSINVFSANAGIEAGRFEAALDNAIKYNDPALINIDSLTAGLKPDQVAQAKALAEAAYHEAQAAIQQSVQASVATAEKLAGGAAQWKEMSNTFNAKAPAHLKAVVSQMLDAGDVANAVQFVIDTAKGAGFVNTGNQPLQGGVSGNGAATSGISQADYFSKLATLEREAGNRSFEQGEYAHKLTLLRDARKLGRNNGL